MQRYNQRRMQENAGQSTIVRVDSMPTHIFSNGSISVPNELACTMQRKRIECAIMIEMAGSDAKMDAS